MKLIVNKFIQEQKSRLLKGGLTVDKIVLTVVNCLPKGEQSD